MRVWVCLDPLCSRGKNEDYVEVAENADIAEKRKAGEGFLSMRPDAPQDGAQEKVGPLRSE